MIDQLIEYDNFIINMGVTIDNKLKYIKKAERDDIRLSIMSFLTTLTEGIRNIWNDKRKLEEENDKLIKILFFMGIYPIEWSNISPETIELALQNDDQVSSNTFSSLESIQANYEWFSFIMERPPKDIRELKGFMKKHGQAPKYEEIKSELSKIIKTSRI